MLAVAQKPRNCAIRIDFCAKVAKLSGNRKRGFPAACLRTNCGVIRQKADGVRANHTGRGKSGAPDQAVEGGFGGGSQGRDLAQVEHKAPAPAVMKVCKNGLELLKLRPPELSAESNRNFTVELMYLGVQTHGQTFRF
jgi:hypothetical protein